MVQFATVKIRKMFYINWGNVLFLFVSLPSIQGKWYDQGEVCFGSNHCEFGRFKTPAAGKFIAIELIHTDGVITCSNPREKSFGANWGCDQNPKHIGTVVTTDENSIIFPPEFDSHNTYYQRTGLTVNSNALGFANRMNPIRIVEGQEFKVWFLEDLLGKSHRVNNGKACANVKIFVETLETEEPVEPEKPVEPTEPSSSSTKPVEPVEPTEPSSSSTKPVEPTEPSSSTEPVEPAEEKNENSASPTLAGTVQSLLDTQKKSS